MTKKALFPALLSMIVLVASGCGLLGFKSGPNAKVQESKVEVEETIGRLASAAEDKHVATFKEHLADTILAKMAASGQMVAQSVTPMAQDATLNALTKLWENKTIENVDVVVSSVIVNGNRAEVEGDFAIDFTDAEGNSGACRGTGTAVLVNEGGKWVVTQVEVTSGGCDPPPGSDPGSGDEPPQPEPNAPHAYYDTCAYLVEGMPGEQVAFLQESLIYLGFDPGQADGNFGSATTAAVRQFQTDASIHVDGEVGPQTIGALNAALEEHGGYYSCGVMLDKGSFPGGDNPQLVISTLGAPGTNYATNVYTYQSPNSGPTLFFVGCIHGNERSGQRALLDAIDQGITVSRGRLVIVPEFNKHGCDNNNRTYNGEDFNRQFPVGEEPGNEIAREMWDLITSQPDLAIVVDFHDGFNHSLANTLIHTRAGDMGNIADDIRDALNDIRPSNANGPEFRSFTSPIGGSLTRKVGEELDVPSVEVELAGRTNPDPLDLRIEYGQTVLREVGGAFDVDIQF